MTNRLKYKLLLFIIILLAAAFRLYNIDWDKGSHIHPDERAIIMSVTELRFPSSISEFLSTNSSWNPHFFAYGSLPFYLLRVVGNLLGVFDPLFGMYDQINLVGRVISALFDLGTVITLYFLGRRLTNKVIGLSAAFFYAVSVLPIQLSHFYAVDTILTFFITLTLFLLIDFYEKPKIIKSLMIGVIFGLSLATKISATVLVIAFATTISIDFLMILLRQPHRPRHYLPHVPKFLSQLAKEGLLLLTTTVIIFSLFEPYALIDYQTFVRQTAEQSNMTKSAFTFPYTLQYVGKTPFIYEVKNIIHWGQGFLLGILSICGVIFVSISVFRKNKLNKNATFIILLVFFWSYFFIVGRFAIGFMRYMLPLYPLLCLFAAILLMSIYKSLAAKLNKHLLNLSYVVLTILLLIWPLSFMQIYNREPTRQEASDWIINNIPEGKTISIEHWDDSVPIYGQERYKMLTLPMYEPDTPEKWAEINNVLSQTDYIIIASNRLYVPLMKMTDCKKLPPDRCYVKTDKYYKNLFDGSLGFTKVAEFSNFPTIPLLNIGINDQSADESFTVYDHTKVMIFKKDRLLY